MMVSFVIIIDKKSPWNQKLDTHAHKKETKKSEPLVYNIKTQIGLNLFTKLLILLNNLFTLLNNVKRY